jgi:hypothetical protein
MGSKPSFVWRSILGSQDLIEEGIFWRIGNGEQTNIWGKEWVPILTTFTIYSSPQLIGLKAKYVNL